MEGQGPPDEEFGMDRPSCSTCGQFFPSLGRLNEHVKRVHGPIEERCCPHCHKTLASKASLPRHIARCSKRPSNVECVIEKRVIPSDPRNPHRKVSNAM